MSILKARVTDGGFQRNNGVGDIIGGCELMAALATVGAGALTGALLFNTLLTRTGPTGAFNETTDTASNILAAVGNASAGDSWRLRYINTVAFIGTLVAGTGVTLSGVTACAASSFRDYLITITNATPQSVVPCTTSTVTPRVLTGMSLAQTSAISQGQLVTGTGIGASAKVVSIQPGVGVTVDVDSTASASNVAVTFSPSVAIAGLGGGLI